MSSISMVKKAYGRLWRQIRARDIQKGHVIINLDTGHVRTATTDAQKCSARGYVRAETNEARNPVNCRWDDGVWVEVAP